MGGKQKSLSIQLKHAKSNRPLDSPRSPSVPSHPHSPSTPHSPHSSCSDCPRSRTPIDAALPSLPSHLAASLPSHLGAAPAATKGEATKISSSPSARPPWPPARGEVAAIIDVNRSPSGRKPRTHFHPACNPPSRDSRPLSSTATPKAAPPPLPLPQGDARYCDSQIAARQLPPITPGPLPWSCRPPP
ncbi:hypothetical protein BDA96_06G240200 [Sorghum bicolor]|uniref:Uncharacterized protein n=1 Tax=Sorghum bicolor TaxID=4558 RepID=A0A921QTA6_SORBI|nr:hypothetical protein BDA96_06G240200 [Sorghum bicolor]